MICQHTWEKGYTLHETYEVCTLCRKKQNVNSLKTGSRERESGVTSAATSLLGSTIQTVRITSAGGAELS